MAYLVFRPRLTFIDKVRARFPPSAAVRLVTVEDMVEPLPDFIDKTQQRLSGIDSKVYGNEQLLNSVTSSLSNLMSFYGEHIKENAKDFGIVREDIPYQIGKVTTRIDESKRLTDYLRESEIKVQQRLAKIEDKLFGRVSA